MACDSALGFCQNIYNEVMFKFGVFYVWKPVFEFFQGSLNNALNLDAYILHWTLLPEPIHKTRGYIFPGSLAIITLKLVPGFV